MSADERPESRGRGRPTDYTDELATEICARLVSGEPLTAICRAEHMPDVRTVYRWLMVHDNFCQMYMIAREDQADTYADEIIDIADTPQLGTVIKTKPDGSQEVREGDMIEHRRLRVDARKWVAAKLKPRKYSEKLMQELTGKDGKALVPAGQSVAAAVAAAAAIAASKDPVEAAKRYQDLMAAD